MDEWKGAIKETLSKKGVLGPIKARIRAEIFKCLDQPDETEPRGPLSNTNLMINELIREYLIFNKLHHTLSVFVPESGQPEEPAFARGFVARELHIAQNDQALRVPLLYSLVAQAEQSLTHIASNQPSTAAVGVAPQPRSQPSSQPTAFHARTSSSSSTGGNGNGNGSRMAPSSRPPSSSSSSAYPPASTTGTISPGIGSRLYSNSPPYPSSSSSAARAPNTASAAVPSLSFARVAPPTASASSAVPPMSGLPSRVGGASSAPAKSLQSQFPSQQSSITNQQRPLSSGSVDQYASDQFDDERERSTASITDSRDYRPPTSSSMTGGNPYPTGGRDNDDSRPASAVSVSSTADRPRIDDASPYDDNDDYDRDSRDDDDNQLQI